MKHSIFALCIFLVLCSCNTTSHNHLSKKATIKVDDLFGGWVFQDYEKKLSKKERLNIEALFPMIVIFPDGFYEKMNSVDCIDCERGKWYFNKNNATLTFDSYFNTPITKAHKFLIEAGIAKKDDQGNFYESFSYKIYNSPRNKLYLIKGSSRKSGYKKAIDYKYVEAILEKNKEKAE